jgi:hypothetical protein
MLKHIGGRPLEQFQAEAKRLLELSRQEQQAKKPKAEGKSQVVDRVSLGQEKPEGIGYDTAVKNVDIGSTFILLRDLVARTLQEQGVATRIATESGDIDLESLTPEEAQTLISEDGYFGVEKTSDRIAQFAIGIAGNDPSRIDVIRKGIEDGFRQAEEAWGGQLPEISYQTRDTVMDKLDRWIAGFDSQE